MEVGRQVDDGAGRAADCTHTSFQTPTTTELINAPPGPGDSLPSGFNPRLRPQAALSYEVGVRGKVSGYVSGQLTVYTIRRCGT